VTLIDLLLIRTELSGTCKTLFSEATLTCVLFVALDDPCLDTTDCTSAIPYSSCVSSRCRCNSGYFEDPSANNVCVAGKQAHPHLPSSFLFNIANLIFTFLSFSLHPLIYLVYFSFCKSFFVLLRFLPF
jgi:hypothetical protein